MSLYQTEEIVRLKKMLSADLFEQISINLSFLILDIDKRYEVNVPLLTKEDLTPLLAKIYLYFMQPNIANKYHDQAYDFFDARLRIAKKDNPSKNLYKYGIEILNVFLQYVPDLELFFRNMYDFYMDYLAEIKYLKRIDFNERAVFKLLITDFSNPDYI